MKKAFFLIVLIGLVVLICAYFYAVHRDRRIKSSPPRYVYETYSKAVNKVIFITNLKYKDDYIDYYRKVKDGGNPSFNFPLRTFVEDDPVYVLGYTSDSSLVKVVSYFNRGTYFGGSYTEGYVFPEAVHLNPPPKTSSQ